jgi:molecular chaperone HtpG
MIAKLATDEPKKFETFCRQFGDVLKEGLAEDPGNKERIAGLLRFHSTASQGDEADRSLAAYVEAAGQEQDKIFYLIADSLAVARSSPHLEIFRERKIEVLLLVDRIDEWMVQYLDEFSGKTLKDVSRGELGFDQVDGEAEKPAAAEADDALMQRLKQVLGERVGEVRASARLKKSAACLVLGEHDLGFQMRQVLKAAGQEAPESVPNLELNLAHPVVRRLAREADDADFERLGHIVFDQAVLAEGRKLEDPAAYMRRLDEFLLKLGLDDVVNGEK